ncbi:MAG: S-layer homology domain-containing protein [Thermoleophilia bacterium]
MMSVIRTALLAAEVSLFALLIMFSGAPTGATASPLWSDLPDDLLASYGLTQHDIGAMSNGYPDHTWRPGQYVTRGQFVRFALPEFGIGPLVNNYQHMYQHFTDVPRDSPYYGWVETAFEVGLIQGYTAPSATGATVFGLYDLVTREQAVTILMRYLSKMEPSTFDYSAYTAERVNQLLAPFADKDQVRRPHEVAMAFDLKVLRPSGVAIMPQTSVTRIQAAALIARTHGLAPPPTYEPPTQEPPVPDHSLWLLWSDAYVAGIQADTFWLGSLAPWMPRELTVTALVAADQDPAVYQGIAETLVSLAEEYKDVMKYERVRVLLIVQGGALVYDHTFTETAQ